jgi:hypothetical protein
MEAYAIEELTATAEAAQPGLGLLTGLLAGLVNELTGPDFATASLQRIEQRVGDLGRELLRMTLQHVLDVRAATETPLTGVADARGITRPRVERGHARTLVCGVGPVVVRRRACRAPGQANLYPQDAVLNLPQRRYSWAVQATAVNFALETSFEQTGHWLAETIGTRIGKRQIEQIVTEAAQDAGAFRLAHPPAAPAPGIPLVLSVDGKGVAIRPQDRRPTRYRRASPAFGTRLGTGEKRGAKRMAEIGVVFDAVPPPRPRTPELIMGRVDGPDGTPAAAGQVQARNRWYVTDITADRTVTIAKVFTEAERRDPGHERTWIALADGDRHQIAAIEKEAARRQVTITILVDFIHVLEYLWKVGWCFHRPRDPAIEGWVTARALDILRGDTAGVIAVIKDLAVRHPPRPGGDHDRLIRATVSYLTHKQPYLNYPRALAGGWPIATGVIEGACRHLVQDRMGITGARWGLLTAEAILALRAIKANGDLDAYWTYHLQQEHHRNHLSHYQTKPDQTELELAA